MGMGRPSRNSEERIWKGLSYHLIFQTLILIPLSPPFFFFFKPTSCFPSKLLQPQLQSSVLKGDPDEGWQGGGRHCSPPPLGAGERVVRSRDPGPSSPLWALARSGGGEIQPHISLYLDPSICRWIDGFRTPDRPWS